MEDQVQPNAESAKQLLRKLETKFKLPQEELPPGTTPLSANTIDRILKKNVIQESPEPVIDPEDVTTTEAQLTAEADMRAAIDTEKSKAEQIILSFFKDEHQKPDPAKVKAIMGMIERGDTASFDSFFQKLCSQNGEIQTLAATDATLIPHLREQFSREAILLYGSRDIVKGKDGKEVEERFSKDQLKGIVEWIGKEKIGTFITGNVEVAQQLLGEDFDPKGDVMEQIQRKLAEGNSANVWKLLLMLLGVVAATMVSGARSVA